MCIHGRLIANRYKACEQLALYQDLVHHFEDARDSGRLCLFKLPEMVEVLIQHGMDLQKLEVCQEVFIDLSCHLVRLQERN